MLEEPFRRITVSTGAMDTTIISERPIGARGICGSKGTAILMSKKDIAEIFKAYGDTRVIQWPFECGESETCVGLLDYYYMQWFITELEKSILYGGITT